MDNAFNWLQQPLGPDSEPGPPHVKHLGPVKSDGCCIIVEMASRILAIISLVLLTGVAQISWGQGPEISWQVNDYKFANPLFAQTDQLGHVYVVKQNPPSGSTYPTTLDIYDVSGNLISSTPFGGVSVAGALAVDPFFGTAVIGFSNNFQALYWDGEDYEDYNQGFPLLAVGTDPLGRLVSVFTANDTTIVYAFTPNGEGTPIQWSVPYTATGAKIDSQGNVLLLGASGTEQSSTNFAIFYSETGVNLWLRSYVSTEIQKTSIAAFVEDRLGNQYLVINHSESELHPECYVIEINPQDGTKDLWQSPNIAGSATLACNEFAQMLVAGQSPTQPFVAAVLYQNSVQTGGVIAWDVPQAADAMIDSYVGPVVSHYDSTTKSVNLINLNSATGAVNSTLAIPASGPTSATGLVENGGQTNDGGQVEIIGSMGGSQPGTFVATVVYGANLRSLVLPPSIVGGSTLLAQSNLTQSPAGLFQDGSEAITLTSSAPNVVNSLPPFNLTSQVITSQLTTFPVDADTNVTITATQAAQPSVGSAVVNVERSATVTVKTATVGTVTCGTSIFNPSQTATGTVALNGPAGPSGKLVTLESSDPSITVPATVKVLAGQSSASFTISSHPVGVATNPSITASLAGLSSAFTVKVMPAPLKSFTVVGATSVTAGATTTGEVIISTLAGSSGDAVTLRSNTASAVVSPTATIPAGGTYTTFPIKTEGVVASTSVTLTASFGGVTKFASFTVEPATLSSLVVAPASVKGGNNAGATIHLNGEAGAFGYVVALNSSNAAVNVPTSITFPANTGSFSFLIKTSAVTVKTPVTISATFGAVTKTATLTLTP